MFTTRRFLGIAAASAALGLAGCGAAGPAQPSTSAVPSRSASATPSDTPTAAPTQTPSQTPAETPSAGPSVGTGLTLQQLGFDNGPEEFSLPPDAVITTSVDQPNVVTVVLSAPEPQTVEDYLRSTLPDEGFTIDARSTATGALTFRGNDWTGGFTGTGASSAIVLRPA